MISVKDTKNPAVESLISEMDFLARHEVAVGILSGKGAEEQRAPELSMAELAAVHEFGVPERGIPERSFLRHTFDEKQHEMQNLIVESVKSVLDGKGTGQKILDSAGLYLASATKEYIMAGSGPPPPLKPATIRRKGSSHALIDTGRLVGSITHEVRSRE